MSLTQRTEMRRTPMPPRKTPLKAKSTPKGSGEPQERRQPEHAVRRETGFSRAAKLLIRTRAGNGDPDQACCEACGRWLGRRGGQCQHRAARKAGGSRRRNGASNGSLLCGTPQSLCHGACERRGSEESGHMHEMGFWLESGQDPCAEPIMLHGRREGAGGLLAWLDDLGRYLDAQGDVLRPPSRERAA